MTTQGPYPTTVHPDIEKEEEYEWEKKWRIDEKLEDQMGFMRKVFGIVSVQMIVTMLAAIGGAVMKDTRMMERNPLLVLVSIALVIGCAMTIFFSVEYRRTVPYNYMLLAGLTLGEAFMFAGLTSRMDVQSVLTAIMALAILTSGIFAATWNMKDCEGFPRQAAKYTIIASTFQVFLILGMFMMHVFVAKGNEWQIVFAVMLIICGSIYLVWDLCYIIVPGIADKDDYALAAVLLYLDIAQIFWNLLILFGEKDDRR